MSSKSIQIIVEGPRTTRLYTSVRKAARALSGNGDSTERTRSLIRRRLASGGGQIGRSWVSEV